MKITKVELKQIIQEEMTNLLSEQQTYIVKSGDWLSTIAPKFGLDWKTLCKANPQIKNCDEIEIGDKIIIPSSTKKIPPMAAKAAKTGRPLTEKDLVLSTLQKMKPFFDNLKKEYFKHIKPLKELKRWQQYDDNVAKYILLGRLLMGGTFESGIASYERPKKLESDKIWLFDKVKNSEIVGGRYPGMMYNSRENNIQPFFKYDPKFELQHKLMLSGLYLFCFLITKKASEELSKVMALNTLKKTGVLLFPFYDLWPNRHLANSESYYRKQVIAQIKELREDKISLRVENMFKQKIVDYYRQALSY